MKEIIVNLLPLTIAIAANMALGIYHKIGTEHIAWSWPKFLQGLVKAGIIAGAFIGLAFVFEVTSLSDTGITPSMIMTAAILFVCGQGMQESGGDFGCEGRKNVREKERNFLHLFRKERKK